MDVLATRLFKQARQVLKHSYSPYSNFKVGACILTPSQRVYTGTNIENASYGLTLCAEAVAIGNMISHGETEIAALLVTATSEKMCSPCGACRQRIAEFSHPTTQIYLCNDSLVLKQILFTELLPYSFDKHNLQDD